jgi:hypothetical protein
VGKQVNASDTTHCTPFWRCISAPSASQESLHSIPRGRAACIGILRVSRWCVVWAGAAAGNSPEQHRLNSSMFSFLRLYEEYYWEQMKLSGVFLLSFVNASSPYSQCSLLRRPWPTVISKAIRARRSCLEHRQRSLLQRFKAVIEPADRRLPVLTHKTPLLASFSAFFLLTHHLPHHLSLQTSVRSHLLQLAPERHSTPGSEPEAPSSIPATFPSPIHQSPREYLRGCDLKSP